MLAFPRPISWPSAAVSVAILEKGYIGGEQSSRNWGWCRQQNRDVRELPLSAVALRLLDELTRDIGRDLGFRRCGLHYASDKAQQVATWEEWGKQYGRPFGVRTSMLNAAEAASVMKGSGSRRWLGGVHSMDDGTAEPALAAPVIAEGARALGATIYQDCAARGLDISNGTVSGVITERGVIKQTPSCVPAVPGHPRSAAGTAFPSHRRACARPSCAPKKPKA